LPWRATHLINNGRDLANGWPGADGPSLKFIIIAGSAFAVNLTLPGRREAARYWHAHHLVRDAIGLGF